MITRLARPVVVVGTFVEALAVLAGAVWALVVVVGGHAAAPAAAGALAAWAALLGVGLGFAGRAFARSGSGLARGVVVTWQLVQAGSAGTIIGAGGTATGALVGAWLAAALAVVVVVAAAVDSWHSHRPREDRGVGPA